MLEIFESCVVCKCWIWEQVQHLWPPLSPLPPWSLPLTAPLSATTRTSSSWSILTLSDCLSILYVYNHPLQASGEMSPQKAVALGKLKVRGNFLLLQKLQGIFWEKKFVKYLDRFSFLKNVWYLWSLQLYQSEYISFFYHPTIVNLSNLFHIFWSKPFKDISTIVTQK